MIASIRLFLGLTVLLAQSLLADEPAPKAADDAVTVKVIGTLRTGVVAIGGETTGVVIRSKNITWELDFSQHAELKKLANTLNGKRVIVTGTLERRGGVEIKERWIVSVDTLEPRPE